MARHSDNESDGASNSSYSASTSRRRSERLRRKYGDNLERFSYSVSPSPSKRKRVKKPVQGQFSGQKVDEELVDKLQTTKSSILEELEPVLEEKSNQQVDSTSKSSSTNCITGFSVFGAETRATVDELSGDVGRLDRALPFCDLVEQYEEFCRQLQPYLYPDYTVAAFQVAKDLYLVRKWSFIRVVPLVKLQRYVIVGSPNLFHSQTPCLYSVIPVPTDSMLSPAIMNVLVHEGMKEKFGHKMTACIFAIIENDTTTSYYRITNSFDDLISETGIFESIGENTNEDSEKFKDLDDV